MCYTALTLEFYDKCKFFDSKLIVFLYVFLKKRLCYSVSGTLVSDSFYLVICLPCGAGMSLL